MEIRVEIKGLDEVKRVFRELPKEIARQALRGALLDGAQPLRDAARAAAPKRGFWPPKRRKGRVVPPGILRRSIVARVRTRPRSGDMTVSIGALKSAFYWHFLEFGHRLVRGGRKRTRRVIGQVAAKPFLRPAARQMPAAVQRVFSRLGPRIEAIARRLRRQVAKRGL